MIATMAIVKDWEETIRQLEKEARRKNDIIVELKGKVKAV